jgi:hypothetical protein
MNFTCTWINRLDQFGSVDIDLLIANDDGLIPTQKVCKNYSVTTEERDAEGQVVSKTINYDAVDEAFLEAEAIKIIEQIVYEYENPSVVEEVV